jgi:hypothetical protein
MLTFLVACSPSVEDVVGTYTGEYVFNGDTYKVVITLSDDGRYVKEKTRNNGNSTTEKGAFEINEDKVLLHKEKLNTASEDTYTVYNYRNNVLENNGHEFVKQ